MSARDAIRIQAAHAFLAVGMGRSLDRALADEVDPQHPQQALARALVYGALRHAWSNAAILKRLRTVPGRAPPPRIGAILSIALTELRFLATPTHAAVNESVEAARREAAPSAGFVNALLRRFLRERASLEAAIHGDREARLDHPGWLIDRLAADWPADFAQLCLAGNQPAPMWLRVDARRHSRAQYAERLAEMGISSRPPVTPPYALCLTEASAVDQLPGFDRGEVSVQDAAAQRVVDAMDLAPGQRVLDACAAPGGKTAAMAERVANLECIAIEREAPRAERLRQTLQRCRVDAQVLVEDAIEVPRWWDGRAFDRILVDAPCSGTGVIRRHPDIKHLRRPTDIAAQVREQARLLDALWPLLAPGGRLTYATCSILRDENDRQIADFCRRTPSARPLALAASFPTGMKLESVDASLATCLWQNPSGARDEDGFFYASLQRSC